MVDENSREVSLRYVKEVINCKAEIQRTDINGFLYYREGSCLPLLQLQTWYLVNIKTRSVMWWFHGCIEVWTIDILDD